LQKFGSAEKSAVNLSSEIQLKKIWLAKKISRILPQPAGVEEKIRLRGLGDGHGGARGECDWMRE